VSYLKLALYGGLVALGFFAGAWIVNTRWNAERAAHALADAKALQAHTEQLANARVNYEKELGLISARQPVPAVRLCRATVQAPSASRDGTSTPTGDVQPVPAGDPASGAGNAGPDIASLLDALAARADQVSAELRVEQGVK
jgi:hypothetical protein